MKTQTVQKEAFDAEPAPDEICELFSGIFRTCQPKFIHKQRHNIKSLVSEILDCIEAIKIWVSWFKIRIPVFCILRSKWSIRGTILTTAISNNYIICCYFSSIFNWFIFIWIFFV